MTEIEIMEQLACEMFQVFAKFEYCLKAAGYCVAGPGGDAKPDWKRFAQELPIQLVASDDIAVKNAVTYIFAHPPKKQVFNNGALQWSDASPQGDGNDLILLYVRRVRNNLFHGGKFNGVFFAPDRSQKLLQHSIVVLFACIMASPAILEAYEHHSG